VSAQIQERVQKLETLLAKVRSNRREGSPSNGAGEPIGAPAAAESIGAQDAPATAPGRAASPLEAAVADQLEKPQPAAAPTPVPAPAPANPASQGGAVIAAPEPPEVSRPVAQVISRHPDVAGASFGDLLRRSLSLRPR
jgi:hypothetical protein